MARAKRTDRAEQRRRYRAYLQQQAELEGDEIEQDDAPASTGSARPSRAASSPVVRPGQKVGVFSAFKLATRPVHYVDDIRYAPTLILKTNAIWVPAIITIAGLVYGLTRTDFNDGTTSFIMTFVLSAPPLIQPMVAGFLAPRATWLAGAISGLLTGIAFDILVLQYNASHLANLPTPYQLPASQDLSFTIQVVFTALMFGAILGAGSGWYKRFLSLAAPAQPKPSSRSGSQKASARTSRRPAARR